MMQADDEYWAMHIKPKPLRRANFAYYGPCYQGRPPIPALSKEALMMWRFTSSIMHF